MLPTLILPRRAASGPAADDAGPPAARATTSAALQNRIWVEVWSGLVRGRSQARSRACLYLRHANRSPLLFGFTMLFEFQFLVLLVQSAISAHCIYSTCYSNAKNPGVWGDQDCRRGSLPPTDPVVRHLACLVVVVVETRIPQVLNVPFYGIARARSPSGPQG